MKLQLQLSPFIFAPARWHILQQVISCSQPHTIMHSEEKSAVPPVGNGTTVGSVGCSIFPSGGSPVMSPTSPKFRPSTAVELAYFTPEAPPGKAAAVELAYFTPEVPPGKAPQPAAAERLLKQTDTAQAETPSTVPRTPPARSDGTSIRSADTDGYDPFKRPFEGLLPDGKEGAFVLLDGTDGSCDVATSEDKVEEHAGKRRAAAAADNSPLRSAKAAKLGRTLDAVSEAGNVPRAKIPGAESAVVKKEGK